MAVLAQFCAYVISLGAFHLSEMTGQTVPVVMGISLLIKTNQPDEISQILNSMHGGDGVSAKTLGKSL